MKQELIERYLKMVKLKDIIKRIDELEPTAKQFWLDGILKELGSDYGRLKYLSGYEQGKLEGIVEREKVKVPQFVADWIEKVKKDGLELKDRFGVYGKITAAVSVYSVMNCILEERVAEKEITNWVIVNTDTFARAWLDGYEVEEEKRYRVRLKGLDKDLEYLNFKHGHVWVFSDNIENEEYRTCHARTELEKAGFGWVFDCEGIEIEEVE